METIKEPLGKVSATVAKDYWDIKKAYDRLTIVEAKGQRACYISRKPVPVGVPITDRDFWVCFSNLDIELKGELLALYNILQNAANERQNTTMPIVVIRVTGGINEMVSQLYFTEVYNNYKNTTDKSVEFDKWAEAVAERTSIYPQDYQSKLSELKDYIVANNIRVFGPIQEEDIKTIGVSKTPVLVFVTINTITSTSETTIKFEVYSFKSFVDNACTFSNNTILSLYQTDDGYLWRKN